MNELQTVDVERRLPAKRERRTPALPAIVAAASIQRRPQEAEHDRRANVLGTSH